MVEERYIWCRNCNAVHHVNLFDKAPAYLSSHGLEKEFPMDDWRAFMQRHAGHRIEGLKGIGEKCLPVGCPMDPMSVGYIEVTDGQNRFVIRSSRKNIEEPLNFELIRGRLIVVRTTLEVQENEIRKEMKYHFPWEVSERLDEEKIELFIRIFKELVIGFSSQEIRISGYASPNGSAAYGVLDTPMVEALVKRCLPHFHPLELKGIRRFIDTHNQSDGVMTLLIRHHYRIEES